MSKSILKTLHETVSGLTKAGTMEVATLREFDALCLPPDKDYTEGEIKTIRVSKVRTK